MTAAAAAWERVSRFSGLERMAWVIRSAYDRLPHALRRDVLFLAAAAEPAGPPSPMPPPPPMCCIIWSGLKA